jgi:hypothetical protein
MDDREAARPIDFLLCCFKALRSIASCLQRYSLATLQGYIIDEEGWLAATQQGRLTYGMRQV